MLFLGMSDFSRTTQQQLTMSSPIDVEPLLQRVRRPAHYAGGEWNTRRKDWDSTSMRLCMVFPDSYEIGMSNLGLQILYELINEVPEFLCDRAFCPLPDMADVLRETGTSLFGLDSRRPLGAFDVLGFSLPYEMGATGVLEVLDLAGVPIESMERGPEHPIVVGGGASLVNPEPMADFFDVIVIGEGEEILPEMMWLLETCKQESSGWRERFLREVAHCDGVYVPSLYEATYADDYSLLGVTSKFPDVPTEIHRIHVDIDEYLYPKAPIVPSTGTVFDRAAIEIHRGCARGCRFCQAGYIDRPVRTRKPEKVKELAEAIIKATGHRDLTLLSLSAADYRDIHVLIEDIRERRADERLEINIPSTRVDAFNVDLAKALRPSRKGSMTFAPEAATERMREVIHKGVSEEDLLRTVELAYSQGWHTVKLYFMIGLPTETLEDVEHIARLSRRVLDVGRRMLGGRARVRVGVSTFVPKSHTAFQWFAQDGEVSIREKQALLKSALRDRAIKFNWNDPRNSVIEALLSLGDRRVGRAIKRAWELGSRLDSWDEWFDYSRWEQACAETGVDVDWFVHRPRPEDEVFPWNHVRIHTKPWVLRWEYEKSLQAADGKIEELSTALYREGCLT